MLLVAAPAASQREQAVPDGQGFRDDARAIAKLVNDNYAYLDRLPGGAMPLSPLLVAEAERVRDRRSLLRYAERALLTLADHHAITGSSFGDSWAVVPSFADLWVEHQGGGYVIDAVRRGSPAAAAGILRGDLLVAIDGVETWRAVASFWQELGLPMTQARGGFAARVLAAGRRDRSRTLTLGRAGSAPRQVELPNLYGDGPVRAPVAWRQVGRDLHVTLNDALGEERTIAAFDQAMANARSEQRVVLDLTETPSGGNTNVARGIMGWFARRPQPYQVHSLPAEERRSGIARQWVEQVLPRAGKQHRGPLVVRVGRWTGSMGEGLAIGLHALGARVEGDRMAGLLGAVYDHRLPNSGLVIKLPTERLMTVDGLPRENFMPKPVGR